MKVLFCTFSAFLQQHFCFSSPLLLAFAIWLSICIFSPVVFFNFFWLFFLIHFQKFSVFFFLEKLSYYIFLVLLVIVGERLFFYFFLFSLTFTVQKPFFSRKIAKFINSSLLYWWLPFPPEYLRENRIAAMRLGCWNVGLGNIINWW